MEIEPVTFLSPLCYRMNSCTTILPLPLKGTLVVNIAIHIWPLVTFFTSVQFPFFHISRTLRRFYLRVEERNLCPQSLFLIFLFRIQTFQRQKLAKHVLFVHLAPQNEKYAIFLLFPRLMRQRRYEGRWRIWLTAVV